MDKDLFMRACREGGGAIDEALRLLDRSLFAVLFRECHRVVGNPEEAKDLVQETFIKVWQRCATFRGDSELLPWVRSILRRMILDRARHKEREVPMEKDGELSQDAERAMAELSARLSPSEDAARRRERAACFARCWKSFESAAPAHATVMSWIVEDGLDNRQIAELLGRTPGATREFISQCRKRARLYLAEWYAMGAARSETA